MPAITLYHAPTTCGWVTLNALEEAGLDYRLVLIDVATDAQKRPEYLAVNPYGKVPALVADGALLTENAAILHYLAELAPHAGLLPRGATAWERGQVLSDLIRCSATLHPIVRQLRMPARYTTGETAPVRARGAEYIGPALALIEARFAAGPWWFGAAWSIIDVYYGWITDGVSGAGYDMTPYPAVRAHNAQLARRPSFARALARERMAGGTGGAAP